MYEYPIVFQSDDETHFDISNRYSLIPYIPELFEMNFIDFMFTKNLMRDRKMIFFDNNIKTILKFKLNKNFAQINFLYCFDSNSNITEFLQKKYKKLKVGENLLFTGWEECKKIAKKYGEVHRLEITDSLISDSIELSNINNGKVIIFIDHDTEGRLILNDEHVSFISDFLLDNKIFQSTKMFNIYNTSLFINFLTNVKKTNAISDIEFIHNLTLKICERLFEKRLLEYKSLIIITLTSDNETVIFEVLRNDAKESEDNRIFAGITNTNNLFNILSYIIFSIKNEPEFGNLHLNLLEFL